jgi:hypothetical protein
MSRPATVTRSAPKPPEQIVKRWLAGQRCRRCAQRDTERMGGVLLVLRNEDDDLEVLPFCYECALAVFKQGEQL